MSKQTLLSGPSLMFLLTTALVIGCASKDREYSDSNETGGTAGERATTQEGGVTAIASGGASKSTRNSTQGGTRATLNTQKTGGTSSTGGVASTGGTSSTGGVTEVGGTTSIGGTTAIGGATSSEPTPECSGSGTGWEGCRGTGCTVCTEKLIGYPLYLVHHKSCIVGETCNNEYYKCSDNCPAPTDNDINGGPECAGVTGGWNGCRASGCLACTEQLVAYPKYFKNHPDCAPNPSCEGEAYTCSSNCPAPTDADK